MKNLLLTLIVVSSCFSSFGQNETTSNSKRETFIIKVGANQSFFNESKVAKWEGNLSYNIGLAYEIPLTEKFYIQPELNYFRLTADATKIEGNYTVGDELRMSVIAIPLMFKYKFYKKFEFELGPQLDYISNVSRTRNDDVQKEKADRRVKNFGYGVSGGLSYDITKYFGANIRYYYGMSEMDERPGYYLAYTDSDVGKLSFATFSLFLKL